eukprot:COSAG02_NODE_4348_length_5467_cov_6.159806_3_plen_155_part_00
MWPHSVCPEYRANKRARLTWQLCTLSEGQRRRRLGPAQNSGQEAGKQASRQAGKQASRQHRKTHNRVWGNLARCEDRNSFTGLCLWRTRSPSCAAQLKASCAAQLNPRIALIKLWLLRADYQPVHLSSAISSQRAGFSEQLHRHRPRCAVVRLT